jgi:hypothetical protein
VTPLRSATAGSSRGEERFSHWLGSLVGLTAILLGIPAVLVAFHVAPPLVQLGHMVARPGVIGHRLDDPLSDAAVAESVALAAWIVWLWLVVCFVVEMVAAIRGRPAMRLPASRHVQALVTTLVGASMAVFPVGRQGLPMRLLSVPTAVHGTARTTSANAGTNDSGKTWGPGPVVPLASTLVQTNLPVDGAPTATASETLYVVERGDTLWSIAEEQLGSPLRWRDIAELNYGRVQPDGGELTDAHWIYPGWELELPVLPTASSPSAVVPPVGTAVAVLRQSTGGAVADEAPSQRSTRPVASTPESGHRADVSSKSESDHRDDVAGDDRDSLERTDKGGEAPAGRSPIPLGDIGYGVLGAGVLALLERLRRVQHRHRASGLRIALPYGDLAALERRLRVDADPDGAEFIDLGLRALVVHSFRNERTPPPATLYRLGSRSLEIVLDPGFVIGIPPEPFASGENGRSWLLSRDPAILGELREDFELGQMDSPFPAVVTVGRDDVGLVLVDLERAGSIDVKGPNAEGILRAIAVEMATAKWSDQVEIVLVGFDRELEALERVIHVRSVADVVAKVQRQVRERKALLTSVGRQANWEIRWAEGGDSWDLCLIICSPSAVVSDQDGSAELVQITGDGGLGVAVVMGSETSAARWHIAALNGQVTLTMNGNSPSVLRASAVERQLPAGIGSLVEVASDLEGVLPTDPPYDTLVEEQPGEDPEDPEGRADEWDTWTDHSNGPTQSSEVPDQPEVEVRVLGQVEIVGAARPFARAWAIELIVYLAMHRKGASSEQWATALWPDRIMAAASLHSTASAARRSLGISKSGEDHLPRAHGRLSLGASVGSDWSRFAMLSESLDPDDWRLALTLIRGRPFEGLRSPDWVLLEGIAANIEAVVVDLASRHAEHCLSVGDPGGAEWSARKGLQVSAYDERLYRILLRSADVAGNPAGVESVMAELVRLVAEDVEPYDAVHPETLDLYRSLSRRATPSLKR